MKGVRTHDFSGDMHDCTGSCKSNYHTITTTMTSHVYLREREREGERERERVRLKTIFITLTEFQNVAGKL